MLNNVCLMGRLTRIPELRQTSGGKSVTSFTLAVDRDGETADFIDCVAWGRTAEFVGQYITKGQLIALDGRLSTRTWTDRNNNKRKAVEVVAERVYFAEPKRAEQKGFVEVDDGEELPF